MTILLIAGAAFLGIGVASNKFGPGREPEQNDLDFD